MVKGKGAEKPAALRAHSGGRSKEALEDSDDDAEMELFEVERGLKRLRQAVPELLVRDFVEKWGLENVGVNPHRFGMKEVPEDLVFGLFGKRCGKNGRAGYRWQDVKNKEVMARVRELHPILYSHDPRAMPSHVKVHFARGIAWENQEGRGSVDWAAFGEETNKTHRSMRNGVRDKLVYAKNKGGELTKEEFKKLKVDKGLLRGGESKKVMDSIVLVRKLIV